jgi:hypothetical protein
MTPDIQWYADPGVEYLCDNAMVNRSYLDGPMISDQAQMSWYHYTMYASDGEDALQDASDYCREARRTE